MLNIEKCCLHLETKLTYGDDSDINVQYLFMELQVLQGMLPEEASNEKILGHPYKLGFKEGGHVSTRVACLSDFADRTRYRSFRRNKFFEAKAVEIIFAVYNESRNIERASNFKY